MTLQIFKLLNKWRIKINMERLKKDLFKKLQNGINKNLYNLCSTQDINVALFGEDNLVSLATNLFEEHNIKIAYIFKYKLKDIKKDINSLDMGIYNKKVTNLNKNTVIIILSSYYTYMFTKLNSLGFKHIYSFLDAEISSMNCYFEILKYKHEINKMYNLLEDDYSRKVIENILLARIFNDFNYINEIHDKNPDNEYFDKSIISFSTDEFFIDAGAYVGDTLVKFLKNVNFSFREIHLFEPDKYNFFMLDNQLKNNLVISNTDNTLKSLSIRNLMENIHAHNLGIYNKNSELKFTGKICMASHVTGNLKMNVDTDDINNDSINVVKLDEFIEDKNVTLIKMDIEGSEIEALQGCTNIISKCKPKLVICIYHKEDHLWSIPIMIKKLVPDYKLYIRHYNSNLWDTVCYAIPR